jgi:hypothetical protein
MPRQPYVENRAACEDFEGRAMYTKARMVPSLTTSSAHERVREAPPFPAYIVVRENLWGKTCPCARLQ